MKPTLSNPKKGQCDQVIAIILEYQPTNLTKAKDAENITNYTEAYEKMTSSWRVMSFFFVVFVLPTLLISVPLYARYQLYPARDFLTTDGDIFSLHDTVNSFWCQGQKVSANGTFEAFQTRDAVVNRYLPRRETPLKSTLRLQHDDAEEWGFYLVKGSSFSFASCARWPGASLVVVKGEENLRKCFYREDRLKEELEDKLRKMLTTRQQNPPEALKKDDTENQGGEIIDDIEETTPLYMLNKIVDQPQSSNIITRKKRSTSTIPVSTLESLKLSSIGTYKVNETFEVTAGNSSFSSSEEFLQQCTETLASIELTPYIDCKNQLKLSKNNPNRWHFRVNESDYYFFIFASDNNLEDNTINFKLLLKRTTFDTSSHISACTNSTECFFSFPFMSPSGVIVDVKGSMEGVTRLEDLHSIAVRSECQPRFLVYTILILLVPFVIVLFAFR